MNIVECVNVNKTYQQGQVKVQALKADTLQCLNLHLALLIGLVDIHTLNDIHADLLKKIIHIN